MFVDQPVVLGGLASFIWVFDETKSEQSAERETMNLVEATLQAGAGALLQVLDFQL